MHYFRAFLVWLLIIFAESIHGTLRQIFLAPRVGDFPARRISVFIGMLLILVITALCIKWINAPTKMSLFGIGLMWVILTMIFEFGLGIFVLDYSLKRMLEDYNIFKGGLMGFGLLLMMFAPLLSAEFAKQQHRNLRRGNGKKWKTTIL